MTPTGVLKLSLEQRVAQIEALLGPQPWAPLHSFTVEKVRETWVTAVVSGMVAGRAIEIEDKTISHRFGDFGDLHTNYGETAVTESITAKWSFAAGLDVPHGQQLTFGSDVSLERGAANQLVLGSGDDFRSGNFASGVSGWMAAADGSAEFQNVWVRGELHGTVFVRDLIDTRAGTLVVAKSSGTLATAATAVASPSTFNIFVSDPPGGAFLFENGDICRMKVETASGVGDLWFTVASRADMGDGTQRYTCTAQSGNDTYTYPAGTPVVDYGVSGQGLLQMTAELSNSPYYDVITHAGAPWTTQTTMVRVGNLAGVTDPDLSPTGYGLFASNVFLKGDLVAGGGNVILDSVGLTMIAGQAETNFIKWKEGTETIWQMQAYESSDTIQVLMQNVSLPGSADFAQVLIGVQDWASDLTYVAVNSGISGGNAFIVFYTRDALKMGIYSTSGSSGGVQVFDTLSVGTGASAQDAYVYGDVRIGQGLWVGSTASSPDDNDVHIDGSINKSTALGARAIRTSVQSLTHNAFTTLSFNSEISDTDTCWAVGAPTRFYAKHDGYYVASGGMSMLYSDVVGGKVVELRAKMYDVGSAATRVLASNVIHTQAGMGFEISVGTCMFYMAVNDYVEFDVYHNMGSAKNTRAASATQQDYMYGAIVRIA